MRSCGRQVLRTAGDRNYVYCHAQDGLYLLHLIVPCGGLLITACSRKTISYFPLTSHRQKLPHKCVWRAELLTMLIYYTKSDKIIKAILRLHGHLINNTK
jgi:cytochrome b561